MLKVKRKSKFLLTIFLFTISACSPNDGRSNLLNDGSIEPPKMPVQFEIRGFSFSPGRSCANGWIDNSYCIATSPKEWTQSEFTIVKSWLSSIPREFLNKVKANGFKDIFRYSHGFKKGDGDGYIRDEPGAWVWGVDKSINVSDMIFIPAPPDPFSSYDFSYKTIVHEFAHAYDSGTIDDSFLELVSWQKVYGEWKLAGFEMDDIQATYNRVQELGFEGVREQNPKKIAEAMTLNRRYGMERGFPTAYAMTNPSECFAELLSHLVVDPNHQEYLGDKVLDWFSENTFYKR